MARRKVHPKHGTIPDYATGLGSSRLLRGDHCHPDLVSAGLRYWRHLALELLRHAQKRDVPLARVVGPIAERWEKILTTPSSITDESLYVGLSEAFAGELRTARGRLGKGKSKPPSPVAESDLFDMYLTLRIAIDRIRELEAGGRGALVADFIVNFMPGLFRGELQRAAEVSRLAHLPCSEALIETFLLWTGRLPERKDERQSTVGRLCSHWNDKDPPAEIARQILADLIGVSSSTVRHRIDGAVSSATRSPDDDSMPSPDLPVVRSRQSDRIL